MRQKWFGRRATVLRLDAPVQKIKIQEGKNLPLENAITIVIISSRHLQLLIRIAVCTALTP
jgi:hypothetical protein